MEVDKGLQQEYNQFYEKDISEWRELGARAKTKNIVALAKNQSFNKVLEVGAGDGSILQKLNDLKIFGELYALEISDSGIEQITKRELNLLKSVQKFDGYKIPFVNNEFDLVYCSHVMEHVEHPRILLREIKRISKYQIFEVPIDFSFSVDKKAAHFLAYGHINIFTPSLFKFLLKSEGFEIVEGKSQILDKKVNNYILAKKRKELSFIRFLVFNVKTSLVRIIWSILPNKYKDYKPQT